MTPRKTVPISIVVPDASPLITLGRIERLDILSLFTKPINIVDVVAEEARRPANDRNGAVGRWFDMRPNNITIVDTLVGGGLKAARARGERPPTGNLGEIAVDEYATGLARLGDPNSIPLVLFEDPDVLELRIARLKNVHLMNTAAFLTGLHEIGLLPDAHQILGTINGLRKTPMLPIERAAQTKKFTSTLRTAVSKKEGPSL